MNPGFTKLLSRGVDEVIEKKSLEAKLASGKKLRVKLGIDPTAKDLHLGHTVVLRKLSQFQELGHRAVLIIGDFTATIGDPSGRNELRPQLTETQVRENMKNYLKEAGNIIDIKKAEIQHNSKWFKKKGLDFFMKLSSKFTVARSLERDDFQKRLKDNRDISLLELLYPILQGYDSVEVQADVELGGTDQKFNLLMGRKVQKRYEIPSQDIITLTLIEGLDGVRKMSKSYGNYIGLSDLPADMYGKVMSIPDNLMIKYFTSLTDISDEEIRELREDLQKVGYTPKLSPKDWKEKLALVLTAMYHGEKKAQLAKQAFDSKFGKQKTLEIKVADSVLVKEEITHAQDEKKLLVDLLVKGKLASSKSEARRKILEGAVSVNGEKKIDIDQRISVKKGMIIRLGKRFLKIE